MGLGALIALGAFIGGRAARGPVSAAEESPVLDAPVLAAPAPSVEVDAGAVIVDDAAPRSPHRRPDCTPPYYLDKKGHNRFRPECL